MTVCRSRASRAMIFSHRGRRQSMAKDDVVHTLRGARDWNMQESAEVLGIDRTHLNYNFGGAES